MFHISKQNVAIRMQAKNSLNVNILKIIWSCLLLIMMNKILRKPVLARNLYFTCSCTSFLLFLTRGNFIGKDRSSHQRCSIKRVFLENSEGNACTRVFFLIKLQASGYFNIFNIINILILLSANAKSAVLLKSSVITKVEVCNFPLLHIPRCLCLVNGQLAMSLRHVKRSVICKF